MRKLVNGKVIEIDNIKLFELAAEGLAVQKTALSNTSDGVEAELKSSTVQKYIKDYNTLLKSMPYPLNAIEADIKYSAIATFIKALNRNMEHKMWIESGLNIKLDESTGMTLKMLSSTWSIVYQKKSREDNTSMKLYSESVGYAEYSWLIKSLLTNAKNVNFYNKFMPDFVRACNGQAMVLIWELNNILNFSAVPNRSEIPENKIIDYESEIEYSMDIFCSGSEKVESGGTVQLNFSGLSGIKPRTVKTFDYTLYKKDLTDRASENVKLNKKAFGGILNIFDKLVELKNSEGLQSMPAFRAVLIGSDIVYFVGRKLFVTQLRGVSENKNLANGVEFWGLDEDKVYFLKTSKITDKVSKNSIYSYNAGDGAIRLCRVTYE